jgi:hypothetical protein
LHIIIQTGTPFGGTALLTPVTTGKMQVPQADHPGLSTGFRRRPEYLPQQGIRITAVPGAATDTEDFPSRTIHYRIIIHRSASPKNGRIPAISIPGDNFSLSSAF